MANQRPADGPVPQNGKDWLGIRYAPLFDHILGFGMALEPRYRIAATRNQGEVLRPGVVNDGLHQPGCGAGAAQGRIGFDMGKNITAVAIAVIGEDGEIVFDGLKTVQLLIVDHRFGSAYIQGSARPMGTIQNRPVTT